MSTVSTSPQYDYRIAGYAARHDGQRLLDNPYPANSDAAAWWAMGWSDANGEIPSLAEQAAEMDYLAGYIDDGFQRVFING